MLYIFFKSLHIFVAISTLLGLLVCTILLLTSDKSPKEDQRRKSNLLMAKIAAAVSVWWILPVMTTVVVIGFYMAFVADWFIMDWVNVKIALAAVLAAIAIVQWRTAVRWKQQPLIRPSRWLALTIPLIVACGASMLYLAFAKPF